jgi:hypothetical protein
VSQPKRMSEEDFSAVEFSGTPRGRVHAGVLFFDPPRYRRLPIYDELIDRALTVQIESGHQAFVNYGTAQSICANSSGPQPRAGLCIGPELLPTCARRDPTGAAVVAPYPRAQCTGNSRPSNTRDARRRQRRKTGAPDARKGVHRMHWKRVHRMHWKRVHRMHWKRVHRMHDTATPLQRQLQHARPKTGSAGTRNRGPLGCSDAELHRLGGPRSGWKVMRVLGVGWPCAKRLAGMAGWTDPSRPTANGLQVNGQSAAENAATPKPSKPTTSKRGRTHDPAARDQPRFSSFPPKQIEAARTNRVDGSVPARCAVNTVHEEYTPRHPDQMVGSVSGSRDRLGG